MKNNSNQRILNYNDNIDENDEQWIAVINLYHELVNPAWIMNKGKVQKLIKMVRNLPANKGGIPDLDAEKNKGCTVKSSKGPRIICFKGSVIFYENNLIEIKQDTDFKIENEIMRSAPANIYKEVCHFI